MIDSHYIGAYWGPRPESSTDCARRIVDLLGRLSEISDQLACWFDKASSKQTALSSPVLPQIESVERLLAAGRHFKDEPLVPVPDLGFHIGIWNGRSGAEAGSLSISCGGWFEGLSNSVVLKLPPSLLSATTEHLSALLGRVVGTLVSIFDPDSLRYSSNGLAERLGLYDFNQNQKPLWTPGWITYVAPRLQLSLPGTAFAAIEPPLRVPGSCVIAGNPPFSVENAVQLEGVSQMLQQFVACGAATKGVRER